MRYDDEQSTDWVGVAVIIALLMIAFVLSVVSAGCRSVPCKCPPVVAPPVVEVPVPLPCPTMPTPVPPVLQLPNVNPEDPDAVLEALASDWFEIWQAWLECQGLLGAYNDG